ncbi:MAG TPA: glutathione S-transferase family protein [Burkholderiales bacterium]|nr:glutathione S-transferase family protein [Burkholderiales bacterium]
MIDLYTWTTANGLRASVMLAESGLEYRVHKLHFDRDTKTPEFLAINPAGMIPVIIDHASAGGSPVTVAQSGAIALYIAEKSKRFLPTDPVRRAAAFQWFMVVASDVSSANGAIYFLENETPEKPASILQFFVDRLLRMYTLIDKRLMGREFLADELSVADLMLYPNYFKRKALITSAGGGLMNLHRWGEMMAARPGVQAGMNI